MHSYHQLQQRRDIDEKSRVLALKLREQRALTSFSFVSQGRRYIRLIYMSIQLSQLPMEGLLTAIKTFKRNYEKISSLLRENQHKQAMVLYQQQEKEVTNIEKMIAQYEESYMNPETAKKVAMIHRQFKEERKKMVAFLSRVKIERERIEHIQKDEDHNREEQYQQGYDFDVQSRLHRQKGQSLEKVSNNLANIHKVIKQTSQIAFKQGQNLDTISQDLESTLTNTTRANQDLEQATRYQRQKSRCCFWLLLFLILTGTTMIVILMFVVCFEIKNSCQTILSVFWGVGKIGIISK